MEFAEVFADGGFDIVVANPPYVRADVQFKHLRSNEDARQEAIAGWKAWRESLLKSKSYQTLYEKWDLYIPFLERAYQLLRSNGQMIYIIPDAYNASKYTLKSHEFFLRNTFIKRIDFCSDIPLFEAGVRNTIVHFAKTLPDTIHQPQRVKRWGEKPSDFVSNLEFLPSANQTEFNIALFRPDSFLDDHTFTINCVELGKICYVSKGMVVHADERTCKGAFKLEDLISPVRDAIHTKRFVLGQDLLRWVPGNIRYLEWDTERAPHKFSRPTFPELHNAREKLLSRRISGNKVVVAYDDDQLYSNQTINIFIPWYFLKGVRNKSIQKTAKYRDELKQSEVLPLQFREDLEELSQKFMLKYLLAIMNSSFALKFFKSIRKGDTDILPDEWKQLPIALITIEEQASITALVNEILGLYAKFGYLLPSEATEKLTTLEKEINERVAAIYDL